MAAALDSVRLVLLLAGLALVSGGDCPAGPQSNKVESREWKIMTADVLLQGKVMGRVDSGTSSTNYSVIFNVSCIYKGAPVPAQIRIDQAGYNPQTCLKAELEEKNGETGEGYLVYLRKISDLAYVQLLTPVEVTGAEIDETMALCDASVSYPPGSVEKECPLERHDDDDCVARPTTVTPARDQAEVQPVSDPSVQEPDSSKGQVKNNKYQGNNSGQMVQPISDPSVQEPDSSKVQVKNNNKKDGNNSGHMLLTSFISTTLTAVSLIMARLV